MSEPNTLQTMDNNELLGKVDELFEWIARQAGDGPIEAWTLAGLQSEIRRRIMEGQESKDSQSTDTITVGVRSVRLKPEHPVDTPLRISATAYHIELWNRRSSGETVFLSLRETQAFLKGLEVAQSFGLPFEAIPEIPADI